MISSGFVSSLFLEHLLPTAVLLAGAADDLRSKKIHNKLIVFLLPFVLLFVFLLGGLAGLMRGGLSFFFAVGLGAPLALARLMGGGDMKLLALFALTVPYTALFSSFFYALPWALVLGLAKMAFDKELNSFFLNMFFLIRFRKPDQKALHMIPFSLPLLFGWLSWLALNRGALF